MKVFVTDNIAEEAVKLLSKEHEVTVDHSVTGEELAEKIPGYDALLVRSRTKVKGELAEAASSLKVIARAGIGVDNIDVSFFTEKGIPVVNAPTGSTQSVAELTLGHMLSLSRMLPLADRTNREGKWEKKRLKGVELGGKVLGLIGLGRIGVRVAQICQGLGMSVIGTDPLVSPEKAASFGIKWVELEEVLSGADYVSIHVPLIPSTKHLINKERLGLMKSTAYLINCARGGVVDEAALYDALKEKKIAGAALDVFEEEPPGSSPLFQLDNFVSTPHIGANTKEGQARAGVIAAEQVIKVLRGEQPDFCVNREVLKH